MNQARQPKEASLGAAPRWPAIGWEQLLWEVDPDHAVSRRARLLARGPYEAAVLPKIAGLDLTVDTRTQALVEAATMAMVRFDADMGHDPLPFSALLLRSESASSSQIENITVGARRIALALLGDTSSANAALVASNVRAMQAAIEFSEDLSVQNIARIHDALLGASDKTIAGKYRSAQVWVSGASPHTAAFVPPHQDRVPAAMEDLVGFMRRDDIPALTQAAVAHAQFETIHPFADGNGRTGRAIVGALLKAKNVTAEVTVPVSSGLLTDTGSYFRSLDAYRDGNVQPIVERFAESAILAVDNGRRLAADIRAAKDDFTRRAADLPASMKRALNLLVAEPAVTAEMIADYAGMSTATAYRTVERLQTAGILAPAGKIKGTGVWVAPDITAALDAFTDRARRRNRG